jgi:SAM-dependent methyltransferase
VHVADTPVGDDYTPVQCDKPCQQKYPLDIFFCRTCSLIQLESVIDSNTIYGAYLYETSVSVGLIKHFEEYAQQVLKDHHLEQGALIVDIGSNDGSLLQFFRQSGYNVLGIEPAQRLAEKAHEKHIDTVAEYFSVELAHAIKRGKGPASIITANNVLANIDNLEQFIEGVKHLLVEDGRFIFETGYVVDMVNNCILDNIYHEHLSYFSLKPLWLFFKRHGFEVVDVERTHTKGGSLRVTTQIKGGSGKATHRVNELLILEKELGFDRLAPIAAFVQKISSIKQSIRSKLKELKTGGKTIAGYGASVGVTTLLYTFEIGGMIDYLFDDNPIKHNTLSPGYHIPVKNSNEIYTLLPDYIILFPWRYAGPIMVKHERYLFDGGHFIMLLPTIEII